MKGVCGPLTGGTPRIGTKRQIGSRNSWENAKRQVWNTILKREAAPMGRIHVCDVSAVPCDDPEDQMVVALTCKSETTNMRQDKTHSQNDSVFKAPRVATAIMGKYPNFADLPC